MMVGAAPTVHQKGNELEKPSQLLTKRGFGRITEKLRYKMPFGHTRFRLMIAARDGDIEEVRRLLIDDGMNPNIQTTDGYTALMFATQEGHKDIVILLLSLGAYPDTGDENRLTVSELASLNGHQEIADILDRQTRLNTRLIEAVEHKQKQYVEQLLREGAQVDTKDEAGYTMLLLAAKKGDREIVRILKEAGANKEATTEDGITAVQLLKLSQHQGDIEMVDLSVAGTSQSVAAPSSDNVE